MKENMTAGASQYIKLCNVSACCCHPAFLSNILALWKHRVYQSDIIVNTDLQIQKNEQFAT